MEISKQELWESRLSDWENRGMDIRSWCRQKNLDENEYSRAVKPLIRQIGNRLSGLTETAYASLLA